MYKIKTSERTNDKATEFETKSLLYLLTKINGQNNVDLFIIDLMMLQEVQVIIKKHGMYSQKEYLH